MVSELTYKIEDLERTVNDWSTSARNCDRIQEVKDRLEREIEKEDFERANKAFAKMNLEGKKPTKYFCSL